MKRLVLALLLAPALAFADGKDADKPADPPPPPPAAPAPAPKPLEGKTKPRTVQITDGTKDTAGSDRQCDVNDLGQIVCKG